MIAVCILVCVLFLPVNLYFWLTENNWLHAVAALLNLLTIALCVPQKREGEQE